MSDDWREDPVAMKEFFDVLGKTISLDFDGTLHPYDEGWCGSAPTDAPPIPGTEMALKALKAEGYRMVISSCRADHDAGREGIWEWLRKYDLDQYIADVTGEKPKAIAYVDDRSVAFSPRATGSPEAAWRSVLLHIDRISRHELHGSAQ